MTLAVQPLVLQFGRAFLTGLLVLLAVCPLAAHAAVLHEEAGGAVPELDPVASRLATVGARTVHSSGELSRLGAWWSCYNTRDG